MHFHFNNRLRFVLLSFVIAFAAVMFLFIRKPHIIRSKNRYIRTFFIFAIAFVPGVLAASICAKTVTTVFERFFNSDPLAITMEDMEEAEEEEKEEEYERKDFAG